MRLFACLILLAALACPAAGGDTAADVKLRTQEYQLRKAAALDRIAVLLDTVSDGRCRLLTGSGMSAEPKRGNVLVLDVWGGEAFITVYPTSAPESLQLPGFGWGKVIGAVSLLVPGSAPGGSAKAEAGVYMLVYPADAVDRYPKYSTGENCGRVALVSVSVGDRDKTELAEAVSVPASRVSPKEVAFQGSGPGVSARFPGKDDVSDKNPANRAHVELTWKESQYFYAGGAFVSLDFITYRFALDLEIPMV